MGSIITGVVGKYRNRQQPVGYEMEIIDVIKKNADFPSLQAMIMVGDDSGPGLGIHNLFMARITIINKGNQDIPEFRFGITLHGENAAIDIKTDAPDRHHVLEILTPVSLMERRKEIDLLAKPFNRNDVYTTRINFTYKEEPGLITLGTEYPVRFTVTRATMELAKEIAMAALKNSLANQASFLRFK